MTFPLSNFFDSESPFFFPDVSKGVSLAPILDKFTSLKGTGKKGSISVIEYQILVAATKNFQESNVLGEGGLGRVYKAQFSDNFQAAVKRLNGKSSNAEREFEVNLIYYFFKNYSGFYLSTFSYK